MAKSKKKPQGKKQSKRSAKRERRERLRAVLAEASARNDPLAAMPPAFLSVPLSPRGKDDDGGAASSADGPNDADGAASPADGNDAAAAVRHFSSPLPPDILEQCLELFKTNMGELYRRSSWGLDVEEKRKEMTHENARFLVVLSPSDSGAETTKTKDATNNDDAGIDVKNSDGDAANQERGTVLGFAHFRYEADDEDDPQLPVTYLYELQIRPSVQKLGLGKKLMTIVELLALQSKTKKVMLTVFRSNEAAVGFYERRKYAVDECSPSNFEGDECANCDYEILSKSFG